MCAVKVSRAFRSSTEGDAPANKRRKSGFPFSGSKSPMVEVDGASEGETLSDLEFLFSEDEAPPGEQSKLKGKAIERQVRFTSGILCTRTYRILF